MTRIFATMTLAESKKRGLVALAGGFDELTVFIFIICYYFSLLGQLVTFDESDFFSYITGLLIKHTACLIFHHPQREKIKVPLLH